MLWVKYMAGKIPLETRKQVIQRDRGLCVNCRKPATEIHHLIHNTKLNVKLYGDKIQSMENLVCVCKDCHNKYPLWDKKYRPEWKPKTKLNTND